MNRKVIVRQLLAMILVLVSAIGAGHAMYTVTIRNETVCEQCDVWFEGMWVHYNEFEVWRASGSGAGHGHYYDGTLLYKNYSPCYVCVVGED